MLAAFGAVLLSGSVPAAAADYAPGQVIVRYVDGTPRAVRAAVQRNAGIGRSRKLPGGSRSLSILDGEPVPATLAELRADRSVEYAVADHRARASAFIPNDPGADGPGGWTGIQWNFAGPAGINAPDAWELASAAGAPGGRGVTVAVLDTGVAYQTRGSFRRAPDLNRTHFVRGYDFVDGDRYPNDENGHGTHVAGTIAESTNNGIGVTGLAYGARIMPLRVLDFQGAGDASAIARAIRFAAKHGAQVINLSLEFDASVTASQIPEIVSAIRYAHSRRAVIVGASGNEGNIAVAYPARSAHVISVAATTENLCQAEYSNSGRGLDVAAPGGGIDTPAPAPGTPGENPRDAASCRPDEPGPDIIQQTFTRSVRRFGLPPGYQGTSMASPHVAATAALIIATKVLGERPSPAAIEQRLKATARDLGPDGYDTRYGAGLIDAAAAIRPQ
jgi:serine protease